MTKKNDNIEKEYFEVIELTDPTTGEKYKQKVKITRYKTLIADEKSVLDEIEDDTSTALPDDLEADEE